MTWSPRNRPGEDDDDDDIGAPLTGDDRPLSGMSDISADEQHHSRLFIAHTHTHVDVMFR
jgi:hypothetical protein